LETGLISQTGNGLQNFVSTPGFHAIDTAVKTPYTMNYNLSVEQAINSNLVATLSYVGNVSRHLPLYYDPNTLRALFPSGISTQQYQPFPDFGGAGTIHFGGISDYNSLQAKLEQRLSHGLSFLATYTLAHSLTDDSDAGGLESAVGDRNMALIPYTEEYANSPYDVRHRFTINGNYQLPFGNGKAFLNKSRWQDEIVGGWSTSLTFVVQTGTPFTVGTANISTANGGSARAIEVGNPFASGGNPNSTNPHITCPTKVKTKAHWYNPCAFNNPLPGSMITTPVTTEVAALQYLGGRSNTVYGPGYNSINMSLFKDFATFRKEYLSFRVDAFNLLNHPTLGNPSTSDDSTNGGQITGTKFFQNNTPDARFLQISAKYVF